MFPAPQVGDDNRAFWTGGREGELHPPPLPLLDHTRPPGDEYALAL